MPERDKEIGQPSITPLHAIILASSLPLFLGAVFSSWVYARSFEVQWTNFASWLVAGGMVFVAVALLWALIDLFARRTRRAIRIHALLVLATFVSGLITALVLAKDGWAAMPAGLVWSIITFGLAVAANWTAHSVRFREANV